MNYNDEYVTPTEARLQLLESIDYNLKRKGYTMFVTQDMITGYYNIIISKGDKSIARLIDSWHSYEPNVYIEMVIKEMISEVDKLIEQKQR